MEVKKLVVSEKCFYEQEQGELAYAFGAEGVGEPASGDSATFPKKVRCCGNDPAVGACVARGATVGAKKDRGAADEMLDETLSAARFEGALEKVALSSSE